MLGGEDALKSMETLHIVEWDGVRCELLTLRNRHELQ